MVDYTCVSSHVWFTVAISRSHLTGVYILHRHVGSIYSWRLMWHIISYFIDWRALLQVTHATLEVVNLYLWCIALFWKDVEATHANPWWLKYIHWWWLACWHGPRLSLDSLPHFGSCIWRFEPMAQIHIFYYFVDLSSQVSWRIILV